MINKRMASESRSDRPSALARGPGAVDGWRFARRIPTVHRAYRFAREEMGAHS